MARQEIEERGVIVARGVVLRAKMTRLEEVDRAESHSTWDGNIGQGWVTLTLEMDSIVESKWRLRVVAEAVSSAVVQEVGANGAEETHDDFE